MTGAGRILAAEIAQNGPIPFSRFMEIALYHPQHGYYRNNQDARFGRDGDFYTASQLQPVFGRLIASSVRSLRTSLGQPADFRVLELGPGRGEMAHALAEFDYTGIHAGTSEWPPSIIGVIFANEFFDALPVDVPGWRVACDGARFYWTGEGPRREDPVGLRAVMPRVAASLTHGYLLAIDYGYTDREAVRFLEGSLLSYRDHRVVDDVLANPGEQDITAHVPFSELIRLAQECGLALVELQSLTQFLLKTGEWDHFASVLSARDAAQDVAKEEERLRLQLKTLLFGLGETFRVALFKRPPN